MNSSLQNTLHHYPFKIILGSASPRRQDLLRSLGFPFTCTPINADESWPEQITGHEIPLYLSQHKSRQYPAMLASNELLLTADTIVWCEEKVLNKPANFEEGFSMLKQLSGKMHEVFTGVTLRSSARTESFYDTSRVYFKSLSDEEIAYYLEQYKPYDKAGAYGVQEWIGYVAIEKIEGSFYNVMGLPVKQVYEHLLAFANL